MFVSDMGEEEKRNKIIEETERCVFVEAGAGAGKTTLIVSRIINQLKKGKKPEDIIVITFTNKAAAELYERITVGLRDEVKKTGDVNLGKALINMDYMQISTIHSFCYRLLSENAFDAELRLDTELIDENDRDRLYGEFFSEWYGNLKSSDREKLEAVYTGNYSLLLQAFLDIVDMPKDYTIKLDDTLLGYSEVDYEKKLDTLIKNVFQETVNLYNKKFPKTASGGVDFKDIDELMGAKKISKTFYKLKESHDNKEPVKIIKQKLDKFLSNSKNNIYTLRKNADENWQKYTKEEIKKYINENFEYEYESYHYNVMMQYVLRAREDFEKIRNSEKYKTCLTNDRLLQLADDLVKNKKKVIKKFENSTLYVDEFQDTDHIQADMIMRLCKKDDNTLREGSLFVVGDPKQSIYRFRGAEVAVYEEIKNDMIGRNEASVYVLGKNFRSDKSIIEWVNNNFQKHIENYQPMLENKDCRSRLTFNADKTLSGVYKMQGCDKFENIAVLIKKCVEDGFLIADENDGFREIQYRDFLILSWSTYGMEKVYQCLEDNGIPVDIAGKIYVNESRTMNSFVRLYKAVACSGGRNSHSYRGMYDIMDNKLHKKVTSANDYTEEMKYVNESIVQLRKKTYGMDAYALARYLAEHMEYYLGKDGEGRLKLISAQKKIEQMIMSAMQEKCMGRQDLVKYFEAYVSKFVEREISLKNDSDTVRFMNVHKAKGLEGNIVIILPGSDNIWNKKSAYRKKTDKGDYDCYEIIQNDNGFASKTYVSYRNKPDIEKESKEEADKEVVRLEYVATTRAKEALIIAGVELDGAKTSEDEAANDENKPKGAPLTEMQYDDCKDIVQAMGIAEEINKAIQESIDGTKDDTSNKNERTYSGKSCSIATTQEMGVTQLLDITPSSLEKKYLKLDKNETENHKEERPRGNIFGNIMHRSFELLVNVYRRSKNWDRMRETISVCVDRALMENCEDMDKIHAKEGGFDGKKEEYRNYLVRKLTEFTEDADVRKILEEADTKIYTELAFSYMVTKKENPQFFKDMDKHFKEYFEKNKISDEASEQSVWIHGFSDLVLYNEKTGNIIILDYKSDRKGFAEYKKFEEALEEKYEGQLDLYDKSMVKIFGEKTKVSLKAPYHLYSKSDN